MSRTLGGDESGLIDGDTKLGEALRRGGGPGAPPRGRCVESSPDWGTKEARLVHPLPPSATAGGEKGRGASDVSHTLSGDGSGRSGGLIDGETWSMKARTRGGVPGALPRGRCDMVAVGPVRRGMKSSDRAPKLPQ